LHTFTPTHVWFQKSKEVKAKPEAGCSKDEVEEVDSLIG
jgi:hypothetical protein